MALLVATRGWEAHEKDLQEMFGLEPTITSGSKFYDPGDAVTRGRTHPFPLYVDGKYTTKRSRSVSLKELRDYQGRAAEIGKRMVLALRYWPISDTQPEDYVVLSAHDFAELLSLVEEK